LSDDGGWSHFEILRVYDKNEKTWEVKLALHVSSEFLSLFWCSCIITWRRSKAAAR